MLSECGCQRLKATLLNDAATLSFSLHMNCSLNSLKGAYVGDYCGDFYRGYSAHIKAPALWLLDLGCWPAEPRAFATGGWQVWMVVSLIL